MVAVIGWVFLAALLPDLVAGLITLPRASSLPDLQRDLRVGHVRSLAFVDGGSVGAIRLSLDGDLLGVDDGAVVWRTGTVS